MKRRAWTGLLVLIMSCFVASCGSGQGGCPALCKQLEPKLIEQLPDVTAQDVRCREPPWTEAYDCDACIRLFKEMFDAQVADPDPLCRKHFG